jgi:hypothetical protein
MNDIELRKELGSDTDGSIARSLLSKVIKLIEKR